MSVVTEGQMSVTAETHLVLGYDRYEYRTEPVPGRTCWKGCPLYAPSLYVFRMKRMGYRHNRNPHFLKEESQKINRSYWNTNGLYRCNLQTTRAYDTLTMKLYHTSLKFTRVYFLYPKIRRWYNGKYKETKKHLPNHCQ